MTSPSPRATPLLHRIAVFEGPSIFIAVDGAPIETHLGETVLAAVLTRRDHLRRHEKTGEPRAGFCLMGACQDCWVWFGDNRRGRACTTLATPGMQVWTAPPPGVPRIV
jgi:hypothetical protein